MSRVGKMLIPIPKGVTVTQDGLIVRAKGAKGELTARLQPGFLVRIEGDTARVETTLRRAARERAPRCVAGGGRQHR